MNKISVIYWNYIEVIIIIWYLKKCPFYLCSVSLSFWAAWVCTNLVLFRHSFIFKNILLETLQLLHMTSLWIDISTYYKALHTVQSTPDNINYLSQLTGPSVQIISRQDTFKQCTYSVCTDLINLRKIKIPLLGRLS